MDLWGGLRSVFLSIWGFGWDERLMLVDCQGEWQKAPSGINQTLKLKLLSEEGVRFTEEGRLIEGWRGGWDAFKVE
jgi:hypothetical protein